LETKRIWKLYNSAHRARPLSSERTPKEGKSAERGRAANGERSYYRPELDVLRFCAFLSVFLYHARPGVEISNHSGFERIAAWSYVNVSTVGSFGVCLFFVLSSFLITELLMRELDISGKVDVKAFYVRRILRIWPLYFSFLLFGYLLGQLIAEWHIEVSRLASFLALVGNWYVASFGVSHNPIAPLWSISIEEQFYLTWPWVARLGGRRAIFMMSTLLLPTSYVAIYYLARWGQRASEACWFSSFVQFEFFALGALAALILRGRVPSLSLVTRLVLIVAAIALWTTSEGLFHVRWATQHSGTGSRFVGYQFIGIGCVVLLVAFLGTSPKYLPRPLIYLGTISYGLYVFHYFWLEVTTIAFTHLLPSPHGTIAVAIRTALSLPAELLLTILTAKLSYKLLEKPFLKLKDRFAIIRSRAGAD
jgi:peptidoglycan/LPS O-acetylase OafA/YrhL